uniref:Uncharacterized protein n=1 Tax=Ackermannviridae sp. TaxID=2831612 RepID=A0A8S5VLN1_9CAUD|nr:MAG TPA: hypothetical protein [Ackermannviridae sp.]
MQRRYNVGRLRMRNGAGIQELAHTARKRGIYQREKKPML